MFETRAKPIEIPERQKLNLIYDRYRTQYENILRKIVRKINRLLIRTNIETTTKYRLKSFNSFFNKMTHLRNGSDKPVEINDFLGIRIICPFIEDLSQVEQIISENFSLYLRVFVVNTLPCPHPSNRLTTKQMHVHMEYLLPAMRICVEYETESALVDAFFTGHFSRSLHHSPA